MNFSVGQIVKLISHAAISPKFRGARGTIISKWQRDENTQMYILDMETLFNHEVFGESRVLSIHEYYLKAVDII
jgi:hypothetical protein